MCFALDGGVWLHRHTLGDERMAHVVSADRGRLLDWGAALGLDPRWLQHKPLKDPRTGIRVEAWHWDLRAHHLERLAALVAASPSASPSSSSPAP
jgi:hypothetical protein